MCTIWQTMYTIISAESLYHSNSILSCIQFIWSAEFCVDSWTIYISMKWIWVPPRSLAIYMQCFKHDETEIVYDLICILNWNKYKMLNFTINPNLYSVAIDLIGATNVQGCICCSLFKLNGSPSYTHISSGTPNCFVGDFVLVTPYAEVVNSAWSSSRLIDPCCQ